MRSWNSDTVSLTALALSVDGSGASLSVRMASAAANSERMSASEVALCV